MHHETETNDPPSSVLKQVGEAFLSSCAAKVEPFFNKLRGIDVYIVEDGQA